MFTRSGIVLLSALALVASGIKKPTIHPFHFSGDLKLGNRISIICSAIDGDPPFTFLWFKSGSKIKNHSGIDVQIIDDYTSKLTVAKLGPESNGNYTCEVGNAGGHHQQSAVLRIRGT